MKDSSPTHPSHFTNEFSHVRPNRLYACLPDNGSPSRHPTRPYPAHSTTDSSPSAAYGLSSRLVQGVGRFFNTRRMTPIVGSSDGPVIWHVAPPNESLEHPNQGNSTLALIGYRYSYIAGKRWQRTITTIDMLPEDTLLVIFDFYRRDAMIQSLKSPWRWHRLAHVCRKWRHVVSMSPRRLDLRILCKSGAPIESVLDSWPTLPLFVRYDDPESKSLPNNIIAALRRPGRVYEIDLVLPSSLFGSLVEVIQEPFQTLERIRIISKGATGPPLIRDPFLGGSAPHLREIKLDGIALPFSVMRQVLLSTNDLVDLYLTNIPNDSYFSAEDLVTGLSTLVQLKRLTVSFHSPASSPRPIMTLQRTTLPCLTFLEFHGAREYLEELVARIDIPSPCQITIKLFNDIFFEIPQFCRFIPRLNALRSPTWVFVTLSTGSVSVFFVQEGKPSNENYFLETSCRRLDWQLSFVTQILSQLSPFLSSVRSLSIKEGNDFLTGEEDVDSTQWLELFQSFAHVTKVHVWVKKLVPSIVQSLVAEDMTMEVLPELTRLRLSGYRKSPSVAKAAEQFIATRRLSGRTVTLLDY